MTVVSNMRKYDARSSLSRNVICCCDRVRPEASVTLICPWFDGGLRFQFTGDVALAQRRHQDPVQDGLLCWQHRTVLRPDGIKAVGDYIAACYHESKPS